MIQAHKERMIEAADKVLIANQEFREMMTDLGAQDYTSEVVKEKLDAIASIVGAFLAIDIAMKRIKIEALKP